MTRASFRQVDLQRVLKAAKLAGSTVQIDLRSLIVTVFPYETQVTQPEVPRTQEKHACPWDWVLYETAPPEPIQPPFDHRERDAMERLVAAGVGVKIDAGSIGKFGPHTQNKLFERGYIEVTQCAKARLRDDIALTKKGLADWKALCRHKDRYPCL